MKKLNLFLFYSMFFFSAYSETIRIASTDYPPIINIENNRVSGVFIDIINESFKKVGITAVYENYPWKRSQQMVKLNQVDAVIPLFKTKEREKIFLFSDPVMVAKNKFFYIKGRNIPNDFQWNTLEDFKKFKVGGVIGYWYLENFKAAGIVPDLVTSDDLNLHKMSYRRIDTFVGDEVFVWTLIKKYYPGKEEMFATLDKPESEPTRHILFSKKNPKSEDFIKKFNKGLNMLKQSGEYNAILKKYNFPVEEK